MPVYTFYEDLTTRLVVELHTVNPEDEALHHLSLFKKSTQESKTRYVQ